MLPCVRIAPGAPIIVIIMIIFSLLYVLIGTFMSVYWFDTQYGPELKNEDNNNSSMICVVLLLYSFLWPVKIIKDAIKK